MSDLDASADVAGCHSFRRVARQQAALCPTVRLRRGPRRPAAPAPPPPAYLAIFPDERRLAGARQPGRDARRRVLLGERGGSGRCSRALAGQAALPPAPPGTAGGQADAPLLLGLAFEDVATGRELLADEPVAGVAAHVALVAPAGRQVALERFVQDRGDCVRGRKV